MATPAVEKNSPPSGLTLGENQVYRETLISRNQKVENASQYDIMGFVNDEIMLRRIEKKKKIQKIRFSVF